MSKCLPLNSYLENLRSFRSVLRSQVVYCYMNVCRECDRCVILTAVENYLAQGKDGALGVTGEGSLLENAAGKS